MQPEQLLARAAELVRAGWVQGDLAVDAEGRPALPWSGEAARWSARGALQAAWGGSRSGPELDRALLALAAVVGDVDAWNDTKGRTAADVVDALDEAIRLLRAA